MMNKKDFLWIGLLAAIGVFLFYPSTHQVFVVFTGNHPYIAGFIKFAILATMGDLLALRIVNKQWKQPKGFIFRGIIWGVLGMVITLIFSIFGAGVTSALSAGLLPGAYSALAFAFFTSAIMNLTFAPTFMAFHRITDTYADLKYGAQEKNITLGKIVDTIDWNGFISFVVLKTIPLFWIPAHTATFLLPAEYRVLVAAALSIALGAILSFAKSK
jgi:hypothetical protein